MDEAMTFVLGIAGSPRRGGNTELLLDAALAGAVEQGAEVRKVVLSALDFSGCTSCGGCSEGDDCVLDDDLRQVYELLDRADAVILASPLYFEGLSSQSKALIDRGQVYWVRKFALHRDGKKRRGAVIAVGARRNTDFPSALRPAKIWFITLDADFTSLTYGGFEEKGSILDDPGALAEARALGRRLADERNIL
jgi:multimeric flavodoxin WrbA